MRKTSGIMSCASTATVWCLNTKKWDDSRRSQLHALVKCQSYKPSPSDPY